MVLGSKLALDHIVVAAQTLDDGWAYVRDVLGVDVPVGGEHLQMGTHNRVARLGAGAYLEIIAVAPHLDAPDRPRWFDLDASYIQDRLATGPAVITWAARTDDIDQLRRDQPELIGPVLNMSRGNLSWRISVGDDGVMVGAGLVPTVLQWPAGPHPLTNMADIGCGLAGLDLYAPDPQTIRDALTRIGGHELARVHRSITGKAYLRAQIDTPKGRVVL